jgi:hypothetical protein
MNPRVAAILVVLLVVLGGGALLYHQQERARRPANIETLGQTLLKDLKAADIAAIRIAEPGSTLTLERKETGWTLAEREGFPADLGKVHEFVVKAIGLRIGQSEPIGEKDRARLALDASGTQVEFLGSDAKAIGKLTVGKKYFRQEVDDPKKAPADGRFVALPDEPKMVYLVSDPLAQASARSADWIDRSSFKVEKVKTLEVRFPGGGGWRVERSGDNADWKLEGARAPEKLDIPKVNAASYSLSLLELADVAPRGAPDTGLDKPTLINATTLEGVSYEIKVGRMRGDDYHVSFRSSSEQPRDKLLSEHVLLVPKAKLEDTLKKRAELLEARQDASK